MIYTIRKSYHFFVLILIVFSSLAIQAQQLPDESIKNRQRAILIHNFAKQIAWNNINQINTFTVGVLGNNSVLSDLKKTFTKRSLFGKKLRFTKINSISEIKNISLLYVNANYNYEIESILKKVSKKNTLVISENYNYNSSMINIISTAQGFLYELNAENLSNENFRITKSFQEGAINSKLKWQELYKEAEKDASNKNKTIKTQEETLKKQEVAFNEQKNNLNEQKNINTLQAQEIKTQKDIITKQFNKIHKKKIEIEELSSFTNKQRSDYESKITVLDSLEIFIKQQQEFLKNQTKEIIYKEDFIKLQISKIKKQKETLIQQKNKINFKNKETLFAYIFIVAILLFSFTLYKKNKENNILNNELLRKNAAIKEKTKILEAQNIEMEQFTYIASHDLQEPLNTITSFIQLIQEEYHDKMDEVGKQSLSYIDQASIRMKDLIKSLLDYSQLGKAKEINFIDPNKTLAELKKDLHDLLKTSKTDLTINNLPVIYADKTEIRLLFQNLITNAIKFSKKNTPPKININYKLLTNTDSSEVYFKFTVSDNGIGIKENHLNKIFAIFQRLHNREEYEGTGIGLAHCKKIVESLNGEIGVDSVFGEGSSFWFTIPSQI